MNFCDQAKTQQISPMQQAQKTIVAGDDAKHGEISAQFLPEDIRKRYKVKRAIGNGGFGVVYLAEDRKIGRLVGLKQLFANFVDDKVIYDQFIQEAKIAGRLEHPNVVIVYNVEGTRESTCIIMEYLGGGSLNDLLLSQGRLEVRTSVQVMLGILAGLDAAHSMMVVHRDIKPQNILFGIGANPKIADFGIARLPEHLGGREDDGHQFGAGTPYYMSPEQITRQTVDYRTDLYSAGLVFYEMLTGHMPFDVPEEEKSIAEIADLVNTYEMKAPQALESSIPEMLNPVLEGLLAKDPDDRFDDARQVIRELLTCLPKFERIEPGMQERESLLTPSTSVLNSAASILQDIVSLLLVDGFITPAEREELRKRSERLGISESQERAIEDRVRREKGCPSLADIETFTALSKRFLSFPERMPLSMEERNLLKEQQLSLGISDDERSVISKEILRQHAQENNS